MTATPGLLAETPRPLDSALARLRLEGAIFLRGDYTERWAYASPDSPALAEMLGHGPRRLVLFHIVAAGRCWVSVGDGERHWAERGDVIVLPYGDAHRMGGPTPAELVPIETVMTPPPWERLPVIRLGEGGERTEIVCGYLQSADPLFEPGLQALPPVFVVRPPAGAAAGWVQASIAYALEASSAAGGTTAVATRLPELVLVEMLRLHFDSAPAAERGWIAALHDPVVGPALSLMHAEPERKWTVADLARAAAVSRSLLDDRFRRLVGTSPIRYLTDLRMQRAARLLEDSDAGVMAVARQVGYDSEEAFSRAFKRAHGLAPGAWRASR